MAQLGQHAVVLGASIGGLLAARVLSDYFETVTVVERDVVPDGATNRRGAPQGHHGHALLGRGSQILDELFPGFLDDLVGAGVPLLDYADLSKAFFSFGGHRVPRTGGFGDVPPVVIPSRPLLESVVRRRVRGIPNVTMLEGHDVVDLTAATAQDRITGARVRLRGSDSERVLESDLVVDATGRGARTPALLEALGFGRPDEDKVGVRLAYSSQLVRIAPGTLEELMVLVGPVAGRPTGMALFGYEDDTWMFTVAGMAGREPPTELVEMIDFAEDFTPPHVLAAIRAAEPLTEVCRFRYPESRWRRYDKMRRFPTGLLVLGDAICSFNPIYGQGMTVAALEAQVLGQCLRRGTDGLAQRYFHAAAKPIGAAWKLAVGADLNLPEVEGRRSLPTRITNRYVDRLQAAAESDLVVAEQFTRVIALVDPPTRLLHPRVVFRVATANRRGRKAPSPSLDVTEKNASVPEPAGKRHFSRALVVVGVAAGRPLLWQIADGEYVRHQRGG